MTALAEQRRKAMKTGFENIHRLLGEVAEEWTRESEQTDNDGDRYHEELRDNLLGVYRENAEAEVTEALGIGTIWTNHNPATIQKIGELLQSMLAQKEETCSR
jgi:hypothetical protein